MQVRIFKPVVALALVVVLVVIVQVDMTQAQTSTNANSGFGAPRPAGSLFEPSLNFIRQNLRLVNSYVALFRSIFVGAYERPLVTSTDAPVSANKRGPSPKVPPMDLPRRNLDA